MLQRLAMLTPQVAFLSLLLVAGIAAAALPERQDKWVNDFAEQLASGSAQALTERLRLIESAHGVEATVVIIQALEDHGDYRAIEPFATELFNAWGVGDGSRNDGVMFLVAIDDREARIELGSGYDASWTGWARTVMDNLMVPAFRDGRVAAGLVAGVGALDKALAGDMSVSPEEGVPDAQSDAQEIVASLLVLVFVGFWIFYRRLRGLPVGPTNNASTRYDRDSWSRDRSFGGGGSSGGGSSGGGASGRW